MRSIFCLLFLLFGCQITWTQRHVIKPSSYEKEHVARFAAYPNERFGFHSNPFTNQHRDIHNTHKSVGENEIDTVLFIFPHTKKRELKHLSFHVDSSAIKYAVYHQDTLLLELPRYEKDYTVISSYKEDTLASLQVSVLPIKKKAITIVPLIDTTLDPQLIKEKLDSIFKSANLSFIINIQKKFELDTIYDSWNNPAENRLRYTSQMIHIRNEYFKKYPLFNQNQLLLFITPNFNDSLIQSYMVKNKALGFFTENSLDDLSRLIAKEYVRSYMNSEEIILKSHQELTNELWLEINEYPEVYSFYDDYEDVKTDNGLIAYYLFEVDENGAIVLNNGHWLSSILRPAKKNTFSYHVYIRNPLFKPLFQVWNKSYNLMHILVGIGVILGLSAIFRRLRLYMQHRLNLARFWRFSTRFIEWFMILVGVWINFLFVDFANRFFEVNEGEIIEYQGKTINEVAEKLVENAHPRHLDEKSIGSEIMVKDGENYFLQREKRVLEFNIQLDEKGEVEQVKFLKSSDSLNTSLLEKPKLAESHYMVFHFYQEGNNWVKDEVYNHLGVNLSEKLALEDPPRRILLFVNGYRPTSLGRTFRDSFDDIKKNGLEFPNSLNRVYDNDRYNYWHPWRKIDDKFKERLNPTETYYADGHYSVATSNYRSLLKFSTISSSYPERCKDSTHHVCYETNFINLGFLGTIKRDTYGMLASRSNKRGFKKRKEGGEIAGRNLYQLLNELPNCSQNDTIYIVAHSMGFAYAQGIVEQLRGKIQLGGFYIIAPEDGKAGEVNIHEWKEVWQYGSNLGQKNQDAPCLQDGVAPQSAVKGIGNHRIYFPTANYNQKGFFDSHFIGYYTWILDLDKDENGGIKQH